MTNRINPNQALPILGKQADEMPISDTEMDLRNELESVKQRGNQIIEEAKHEIYLRNTCIQKSVDLIKKLERYLAFCVTNGIISGTKEEAEALVEEVDVFINGKKSGGLDSLNDPLPPKESPEASETP